MYNFKGDYCVSLSLIYLGGIYLSLEVTTQHRSDNNPRILAEQIRQEHTEELNALARFQRVSNYLAAAQIYLKQNALLQEPLKPEDIKDRLLGHWGTSPGINMIYAHLNHLITRYDIDMFMVTGPGHGAPANLANLYLEALSRRA